MPIKSDGRTTDTKQRILKEAKRMYLKAGYAGMSLQEIADQLDISKPALFHHFRSKQELFYEVLLDLCESTKMVLLEAIQQSTDTRSRLRNVLMAMRQQPFFDPMKFLNDEVDELNEEQQHQVWGFFDQGLQAPLVQILDEGISQGELRPHNTRISSMAFTNLMMLLPSPDSPLAKQGRRINMEQFESYIDELLQLFVDGVRK